MFLSNKCSLAEHNRLILKILPSLLKDSVHKNQLHKDKKNSICEIRHNIHLTFLYFLYFSFFLAFFSSFSLCWLSSSTKGSYGDLSSSKVKRRSLGLFSAGGSRICSSALGSTCRLYLPASKRPSRGTQRDLGFMVFTRSVLLVHSDQALRTAYAHPLGAAPQCLALAGLQLWLDSYITRFTAGGRLRDECKLSLTVRGQWSIFKSNLISILLNSGIVHPKMKILSSFTHPQVVPNLY